MKEFRDTGYYVFSDGTILGKKKILKKTITPYGYYSVCLYYNGLAKTFLVHRMVAECYIPNPENKPEVNHWDGDKLNNHESNLIWSTSKENIEHYHIHLNKKKIGEKPNSKLNYQQMTDIYKYSQVDGIYSKILAKKYNVATSTISRAIKTIKNEMKSNR